MKKNEIRKVGTVAVLLIAMLLGGNVKAQQNYTFPQWFDSVKLGIMIHYGLYSVPSYSDREQYAEWFYKGYVGEDTLRQNFVKRVYGDKFDYFDFTKYFTAELFDAEQWIDLFERAGAKYIVFSSKHHDGFCLWDTKTTEKNSMNSPAHRDFIKELRDACDKNGNVRFGLYYSLMEWHNPIFRWTFDTVGLEKYVDEYMLPQFKELVDLYKPSLVFADGDWDFNYKQLKSEEMVNYLIEKVGKDEAIVNNRWGNGNPYGFLTPEYSAGINVKDRPWSECRSLARSFGLNRISPIEDYLTAEDLVQHFVQLVSMGGGLMLNVGPAADGRIPLLQQERLLQLGEWLNINGDAIYGTKAWEKSFNTKNMTDTLMAKQLNFNWVRNSPKRNITEDNFQIVWKNTVVFDKDTTLLLQVSADDEANVQFITKKGVVYNQTAKINQPINEIFSFKKGEVYEIVVSYEETDLEASLSFKAKDLNDKEVLLPVKTDWYGEVTCLQPTVYFTAKDDDLYAFEMNDLSKSLRIYDMAKPNKDMKITLLGSEHINLKWKYVDNKKDGNYIEIDLSDLSMADVKSKYAYVFKLEGYLKAKK